MTSDQRGIQSVEVGGQLLRALADGDGPMMLRDLARNAGMSAAKAHPYLVSFMRIGLVEQDKAMLEMSRQIEQLRRELNGVRDRMVEPKSAEAMPSDERPPHY